MANQRGIVDLCVEVFMGNVGCGLRNPQQIFLTANTAIFHISIIKLEKKSRKKSINMI